MFIVDDVFLGWLFVCHGELPLAGWSNPYVYFLVCHNHVDTAGGFILQKRKNQSAPWAFCPAHVPFLNDFLGI